MVERDLAKVETRVRFSSPAPFKSPGLIWGFWFLYLASSFLHISKKLVGDDAFMKQEVILNLVQDLPIVFLFVVVGPSGKLPKR